MIPQGTLALPGRGGGQVRSAPRLGFYIGNYLSARAPAPDVETRGTSIVERAVELFSKLDAELDGLEAEVRAWGRQLLSQADRLSADARVRLLEAARARGEERLREIERRANAEAEEMLRGEEKKLEDLRAAFEAKRERLVELALGMLLPREG